MNDPKIRENFIVKVFSFYRLQNLFNKDFSIGGLVRFHTQQKFLLLAHSRKYYDLLGQLVANSKSLNKTDLNAKYGKTFMEAMAFKATTKKNTDVLLHMMGFLKKILTKGEKEDIEGKINLLENVDGIANAITDGEKLLNNEQGVIDYLIIIMDYYQYHSNSLVN